MGFRCQCFRFEGGGRPVLGLKRTGKSCRLRWVNYLHPGLKRGKLTPHEEKLVVHLHSQLGNRWSRIARKLPGRTDNEIKNYWRTHMRKKAQEQKRKSAPSSCPSSIVNKGSPAGGMTVPEEQVYSMDDIWKDIGSSEEVIKPMCSGDSGLWDTYWPWKTEDEEGFPF